jgi:hypothetical protein
VLRQPGFLHNAQRRHGEPNHGGRALAASEAGRTARADAAKDLDDLARPCIGLAAWDVQAFESRLLKAR